MLVNGLLFVLMGVDKFKAQRNRWRIPEKVLLGLGLLGGGLGGLAGQQIFHHKTRKVVFYVIFIIGLIIFGGLWLGTKGNVADLL